MATITPEIKRAIEQADGQPVRLDDPVTSESYVLLKADEYDRLRRVCDDEDRQSAESIFFPGIQEAFEDWSDPAMDAYNDLDPRR